MCLPCQLAIPGRHKVCPYDNALHQCTPAIKKERSQNACLYTLHEKIIHESNEIPKTCVLGISQ